MINKVIGIAFGIGLTIFIGVTYFTGSGEQSLKTATGKAIDKSIDAINQIQLTPNK